MRVSILSKNYERFFRHEKAHPNSHRWKTICVSLLWIQKQYKGQFESSSNKHALEIDFLDYLIVENIFFHCFQKVPIHIAPKKWGCPYKKCFVVMERSRGIKQHIFMHTGEKPFACTQCKFKCNNKYNLKLHVKNRHTGNQ